MTIYILHEIYDTFDSDHELFTNKNLAEKIFGHVREKVLNESKDEMFPYAVEVYRDEKNDLSILNSCDEHVRVFITEHIID